MGKIGRDVDALHKRKRALSHESRNSAKKKKNGAKATRRTQGCCSPSTYNWESDWMTSERGQLLSSTLLQGGQSVNITGQITNSEKQLIWFCNYLRSTGQSKSTS